MPGAIGEIVIAEMGSVDWPNLIGPSKNVTVPVADVGETAAES